MLNNACRIILRSGYLFVWIGVEENNERKVIKYSACAESESEKNYTELIKADAECECGPCGTAIHTELPVILNDKSSDDTLFQWREKARQYGFESAASFPLNCDGSVLGAITIYSGEKNGFEDKNEIEILKELANDMATGITILEMRSNHNLIEKALRTCEEKNRILLQKIQVAIIVYDINSRIVISNPKAQELLELTEEELLKKKPDDFIGHFFYEDGSLIPPEKNPVAQVLTTGETVRNFTVRVHHPGSENDIWVLINADPVFDHEGEITQIIVTFTDITDRKKAEEMFQKSQKELSLTLEAARIGYWEWDVLNDRVYATPVYYTMLGYRPQKVPGSIKEWLERVHPQDRAYVGKQFESALSRNFKEYQYEARFRLADGTYRWIQSKGFGFEHDKNGMVTRLTGIRTDIHERKLAEQEHLATIRFFKSMDLINQAIRGSNDLEQMMSDVLDGMLSIFNTDLALLEYPCDPQASLWRIPMERSKPEFLGKVFSGKLELPVTEAMSQKLINANGYPVTFGDNADYPLDEEFTKQFQFQSLISMAVYPKVDNVWNLSMGQCSYSRIWTQEDKKLFQEIGRRLGDGLTTLLMFRNLQKNEAKYRRIVDTSIEGIWMINEDGITTYVNKRITEMLGYREEEMINHSVIEFFFEEDIPDHKKKVENRKKGLSETYERRHRHKNGYEVWTMVSASPIYDDENRFIGSFAMFTDITQRKIAEEKLRESEEHLRITLDAARVGIWEWDVKNNRLYSTPVYYTMLGYNPQAESSKTMEDWLDLVHTDDRDKVKKILQSVYAPDFKEFKYEARFRHADGTYKWIQSKGFAFERDQSGVVIRVIGTRIDIQERKIAEQEHLATIHFFKSMDQINQAIRSTNDLEQMMSDVLDTMLSIFDAEQAVLIYPCDAQTPSWQVPMERAKPGFYGKVFKNKLEVPTSKMVADIFQMLIDAGGRPIIFGPEADHPLLKEFTKQFSVQSQISMAVYPKIGKPWELTIDHQSFAKVWTLEEKNLFQEIGRRLADGLSTLLVFRNLQESETKYRRIVDTTNEGIWIINENNITAFVNKRIAEMLGYQIEELMDYPCTDYMFNEDVTDHYKRMETQKLGITEVYEQRFRHKNGQIVWALLSATPVFDEAKNFKGAFGMLTDITQRKIAEEKLRESEERLRVTLEAAQIGIWDWDLVNNLWYATPYSYTALGYEPKNEPVGLDEWLEMMHPDDQKIIKSVIEKVYLSQNVIGNKYEVRYKYAGDGYRWMMVQGFIFNRDKDGRITRMVGVRIDIDDRKRAEEELKKYREHLEDLVAIRTRELSDTNKQLLDAKDAAEVANRAKSRFLASMSHELRTPLNAILGYAQIFELDATLNEHQKAGIEIMKNSGEHLLTLISDILDLSKIEANKIKLHPFGIDFRLFLDSISDVIRIRAEAKPISVYFQIEPDIPQGIIADQTRLRQVLLNLLGNAIKFTDSGYMICRVSVLSYREKTEEIQSRQCTIRFEIKDTGTGIRIDQLEKIFAPFEQVRNVAASEGVGLGLTISRQLVQMMGGDILVESEFGKGSRFWFDLTFPTTDVSVPFKPVGKIITGYKGARKKILIVDDRQTNRQVLTAWFSQLGFDIAEAKNGIQAISMVRQITYDLILMDLIMPNMNGFDTALNIREIPELSSVVMIAMSASMTNVTDEQCKKAGFNDFLSKPVDLEKLSDMLEKYMHLEWIYEEKTAEEISGPVILPPAEELNILHELILRGDMLQLSRRAQQIETLGKQYIPFAHKLKYLADNFQEHRIEVMIEDALKKQNGQ